MARIQVLPDDLVNQIAAGEVIERPASVVKELVENALDAEASRVDVAIEEGGSRRLEVADDGTGMSRADAELAFQRHATSKIRSLADLGRVGSLGFRGEALPSIASVAAVRMQTRRAEDRLGVELAGEGGGIPSVREVACPAGTRVEVMELFGRIPARRKFLKTAVTEAGHVVRWLERIALARPDVRLALRRDGRESLVFLPTASVRERAIAVLPSSVGSRLMPVEAEGASARLTGFATPTDVLRGTTADIHVFVSGRPVRDRFLLHLVADAYRDALPAGRHPAAVLYLQVDPGEVDHNVHPAKWEVRFRDPRAIRALLRDGLRRALGAPARVYAAPGRAPVAREPLLGGGFRIHPGAPASTAWTLPAPATAEPGSVRPAFAFRSLRYLGQALGAYLVLEGPQGLVLLDQHAAHERVLFERLRVALGQGKLERQVLLVPLRVELTRSDADALARQAARLERAGFELELQETGVRGGVVLALSGVPAALAADTDWQAVLEGTAAALREPESRESRDGIEGAVHAALATAACHAACRKGDRLDAREVDALLEALDANVWYPNCPHGRPIWLHLDEGELERRFLRRP